MRKALVSGLPSIAKLIKAEKKDGKRLFVKVGIGAGVVLGVLLALGVVVWLWPNKSEVVSPQVEVVAEIKYPGGSLECVDLYYGAVRTGNHKQYQVCLEDPLPIADFQRKYTARVESLKKNGFIWDIAPVKKGIPGIKGNPDKVWATSPWTGEEETYMVVKKGQYWRIVEER